MLRTIRISSLLMLSACASAQQLEFERLSSRTQKDCGSYFPRPSSCPEGREEVITCFVTELAAGRAAKFSWTMSTIEGDPTVMTFFTSGTAAAIEFVDSRADTFGDGQLKMRRCSQPKLVSVDGCTQLNFDECSEAP